MGFVWHSAVESAVRTVVLYSSIHRAMDRLAWSKLWYSLIQTSSSFRLRWKRSMYRRTNRANLMYIDPFYVHHAANKFGRNHSITPPNRRSVRSYVSRIWKQMALLFADIGSDLGPRRILVSQLTDSKIGVCRLKATVSVVNIAREHSKQPPAHNAIWAKKSVSHAQ
jgi:hypothetical protein